MDSDRMSLSSRSGDRPVTRWRREQESSSAYGERPTTAVSRSFGKMERPTSRRGVKSDMMTEFGMSRPTTSGKSAISRPPSASMLPYRAPTSLASSRSSILHSANQVRISSAVPRTYVDRPVTQQGLVGVRPISSREHPRLAKYYSPYTC